MKKRVFLIVIDGFGVGEAPDANCYKDVGSNTFLNIQKTRQLNIPMLSKLGLKDIDGINIPNKEEVIGAYGKMRELSVGKDTTTGHFEMMGIVLKDGMPTYPNGFPKYIIEKLEKSFGVGILGNCVASGTEIIKRLGDEHIKTKNSMNTVNSTNPIQGRSLP